MGRLVGSVQENLTDSVVGGHSASVALSVILFVRRRRKRRRRRRGSTHSSTRVASRMQGRKNRLRGTGASMAMSSRSSASLSRSTVCPIQPMAMLKLDGSLISHRLPRMSVRVCVRVRDLQRRGGELERSDT